MGIEEHDFVHRCARKNSGGILFGKIRQQELIFAALKNMRDMKGEQMRKLCDKDCGNCNLDECLQKYPPYDSMLCERRRTETSKKQRREYQKRKRELCIAFGICRECMCKIATNGNYCLECYLKNKKRSKRKRNGVPRAERVSFGLCYFCGEPAEKGFKTCRYHHLIMANNVKHTNYNDNKYHIWRQQNKLIFKRVDKAL